MNEILEKYKVLIIGFLALLMVGYVIQLLFLNPADERRREVFMEQWYAEYGEYPTEQDYTNY